MSEYALYIGPEGWMGFKLLKTEIIIHQHRASTYNTSVVQKKIIEHQHNTYISHFDRICCKAFAVRWQSIRRLPVTRTK